MGCCKIETVSCRISAILVIIVIRYYTIRESSPNHISYATRFSHKPARRTPATAVPTSNRHISAGPSATAATPIRSANAGYAADGSIRCRVRNANHRPMGRGVFIHCYITDIAQLWYRFWPAGLFSIFTDRRIGIVQYPFSTTQKGRAAKSEPTARPVKEASRPAYTGPCLCFRRRFADWHSLQCLN